MLVVILMSNLGVQRGVKDSTKTSIRKDGDRCMLVLKLSRGLDNIVTSRVLQEFGL